jgi:hypothetical protein
VPVELPILPKRVAENVGQFTGRAWLLPKILEWWDEGDERLFLLTGGPGTGKSMILAWLAGFGPDPEDPGARAQLLRLREVDKAVQFCQASSRNITPQAFAENIANQLTHTVPGFRDALAATLADRVSIVGTAQAGTTSDSSLTGVLAMLPNGRHLIFGYDRPESRITVWDWIDRKDLLTLWLPKTYINDIAIVGDGRRILAATDSGAVKVIDIACGEEMESLQGHSDRVTALGVTPDGSRAVSASRDGTIRVWDLATGREIAHFRGEDSFEACAIAPDGRYIMAGEVSGRIHFLRLTGAGKG